MRGLLGPIALIALSACAAVPARDPFDIAAIQRRLDERGLALGVTRAQGENALLLQLRFRPSDAVDAAPLDVRAAAEAAAPDGCQLSDITPQPDGQVRAVYTCR